MLETAVDMMCTGSNETGLANLAVGLKELGRRHIDYGVGPLHFSVLETAVLRALTKALGENDQWTSDARKGWAAVLKFIGKAMMSGARAGAEFKIIKDERRNPQVVANDEPCTTGEDCPERGTLRFLVVDTTPKSSNHMRARSLRKKSQSQRTLRRTKTTGSNRRRSHLERRMSWDEVIFQTCELSGTEDEENDTVLGQDDHSSVAPSVCDSSVSTLSMCSSFLTDNDDIRNTQLQDPLQRIPARSQIELSRHSESSSSFDCTPTKPRRDHDGPSRPRFHCRTNSELSMKTVATTISDSIPRRPRRRGSLELVPAAA